MLEIEKTATLGIKVILLMSATGFGLIALMKAVDSRNQDHGAAAAVEAGAAPQAISAISTPPTYPECDRLLGSMVAIAAENDEDPGRFEKVKQVVDDNKLGGVFCRSKASGRVMWYSPQLAASTSPGDPRAENRAVWKRFTDAGLVKKENVKVNYYQPPKEAAQ